MPNAPTTTSTSASGSGAASSSASSPARSSSTNTATITPVLNFQPSTLVTSDMGASVNSALKTGTADKKESALSAERDERVAENNKAAQDALQMVTERLKPGAHRDYSSFAAALMESFKDSMLIAQYYHDKELHADRRGPGKFLWDKLVKHRDSKHEMTIDDLSNVVQVNDKGEITIPRTVSLPTGAMDKDGKPMFEDVQMSENFQQDAQKAFVEFFRRQKDSTGQQMYEVDESDTKNEDGDKVFKVRDLASNQYLTRQNVEDKLGADRQDFKATLASEKAAFDARPKP